MDSRLISGVKQYSPAEFAQIKPGDILLSVNGQDFSDIIDLSFLFSDEELELLLQSVDGSKRTVLINKEIDEEVGLEFETAVFDKVKECCNNCIFCFVNQMPEGMRDSLYIKDDDYRLSFLYGNFITLTNITPEDKKRILSLNLSPLYVSIHATDGQVRTNMIKNKYAGQVIDHIKELAAGGIKFHTQIVLCPTFNDEKVLEQTFKELFSMNDSILSMAVVPVGLTKYRRKNDVLRTFTTQEAKKVVDSISCWQKKCRDEIGRSFVYPSDEFYVLANEDFPIAEYYDGFQQYENGIGICRKFIDEWHAFSIDSFDVLEDVYVVCGKSAQNVLQKLINELTNITAVKYNLLTVENKFFGDTVTVTGLLTGNDILDSVKELGNKPKRLIVPGIALREDRVFLDDVSIKDFCNSLPYEVKIANTATQLKKFLVE